MPTPALIDELKRLDPLCTQGELCEDLEGIDGAYVVVGNPLDSDSPTIATFFKNCDDAAWFILTREAVPALIVALESAEAENAALRKQVAEMAELAGKLAHAADRLYLYSILHEQQHPEWNGNRFDDQQFAKTWLAKYQETMRER